MLQSKLDTCVWLPQKVEYVPEIHQYLTLKRLQLSSYVNSWKRTDSISSHCEGNWDVVVPYPNHMNVASAGGKMQQLHKLEANEPDPEKKPTWSG